MRINDNILPLQAFGKGLSEIFAHKLWKSLSKGEYGGVRPRKAFFQKACSIICVVVSSFLNFAVFADEATTRITSIGTDNHLFHEPFIGKGELHITSKPGGARIFLNGEATSYKTPATIPDLIPGRYEIRVVKRNHSSIVKDVWVEQGKTLEVEIRLPGRLLYGCLASIVAIAGAIALLAG